MADILNKNQMFATPGEALLHYGTKGMKWGIRKDRLSSGSSTVGEGDLAPFLIVTAIFAGIKIAQARISYVDSGRKHQKAIDKEAKKSGKPHEWKRKDSLTGPKTHDEIHKEVVLPINKGFPKESGTSMNCRRCTFAYEMRRRGLDVKATRSMFASGQDSMGLSNATRPDGNKFAITGWGKNTIPTTVNGRQMTSEGKSRSIFNALSREPDGSRGELAVSWPMGGGHSVAYEIVAGKPIVFDAQSGKYWVSPEAFNRQLGGLVVDAAYTRLDNADLNYDFLKRWATNA